MVPSPRILVQLTVISCPPMRPVLTKKIPRLRPRRTPACTTARTTHLPAQLSEEGRTPGPRTWTNAKRKSSRFTHQATPREARQQPVKVTKACLVVLSLEVPKEHSKIVSCKVSISSLHTTAKKITQMVQVEFLDRELVT